MMVYNCIGKIDTISYLYNEKLLIHYCLTCAPSTMFCFEFLTAIGDFVSSFSKNYYIKNGKENRIRKEGKIK